mgnify:CR=1 FL=1
MKIDINSDLGEGFGPYEIADDAELMAHISSANVACGFHAGDWDVMANTMAQAVENGVGIGAHPGFADLHGFGRQSMQYPLASLQNLVRYQVGAAQAMARAAGARSGISNCMGRWPTWRPRMRPWRGLVTRLPCQWRPI